MKKSPMQHMFERSGVTMVAGAPLLGFIGCSRIQQHFGVVGSATK